MTPSYPLTRFDTTHSNSRWYLPDLTWHVSWVLHWLHRTLLSVNWMSNLFISMQELSIPSNNSPLFLLVLWSRLFIDWRTQLIKCTTVIAKQRRSLNMRGTKEVISRSMMTQCVEQIILKLGKQARLKRVTSFCSFHGMALSYTVTRSLTVWCSYSSPTTLHHICNIQRTLLSQEALFQAQTNQKSRNLSFFQRSIIFWHCWKKDWRFGMHKQTLSLKNHSSLSCFWNSGWPCNGKHEGNGRPQWKYGCWLYYAMPGCHQQGDPHYYPVMKNPINYEMQGCDHGDITCTNAGVSWNNPNAIYD